MESTSEFVKKVQETQRKAELNRKKGSGNPDKRLPNNQHHQGH
ncbi:DUF4023 family protein [Calidifontibacillus oryziterrae]|nr:DUF4023 family protein [Calidifontibacillus oryziterrae]